MLRYLGQSMSYVPFHNRKPLKEFGKHNSGNKMKSLVWRRSFTTRSLGEVHPYF